jgi:membrane associated rhomboid family serine protease
MNPMRSRNLFGPGGPLNAATAATKLAIALIAGSLVEWLLPQDWAARLVLTPAWMVERFALWQPITYAFIETSELGVIFGALILWSVGGALEMQWGPRRLVTFAVGLTAAAGLLTAAVSLLWPSVYLSTYAGGTVMTTAVWVAYGWSLGRLRTGFWGMPLSGNALAWIGVGFVVLRAARVQSLVPVIPEVVALVFAYVYVKVGTPRALVLRLRQWKLQRELRARSRHLRVVSRDRNTNSGSDRYIH